MAFSILIPSKNIANLRPCIDAISAAGETARIIVIDDGLAERWDEPGLEYVWGRPGFVYARNINIGIAACGPSWSMNKKPCQLHEVHVQTPGDDVILLNDDALLKTPMGFTRMVEEAHKYTELGIVSAACNNVGNTNQHPKGIGMRADDRMVCFVAVLIKRTTIDAVGLLDERYVKYGLDDDDYCFRVRHAGLKIGIFDHCIVDHSELTSSFRGGPADAGDFKPNLRLFIEKWGYDNRGLPKEQSPWKELFPA